MSRQLAQMPASLKWWQQPPPPPPVRWPRRARPGVGPVMVIDPGGQPAPLIAHDAHRVFCGFRTFVVHPRDPRLARCSGCRCWLVVPLEHRRGGAVA